MKNYKELELYKISPKSLICGLDEVGRGCCWGPMTVAGVILPSSFYSDLITDSKNLSAKDREKAFEIICKNSIAQAASFVSTFALESFGMTMATKMAMIACVESCQKQLLQKGYKSDSLKYILIDAINLTAELSKSFPYTIGLSETKFESRSISVASASIVAKVLRDQLVKNQGKLFPAYNLEKHKGYSTLGHFKAIVQNKPSFLHRKNFVKTLLEKDNKYNANQ